MTIITSSIYNGLIKIEKNKNYKSKTKSLTASTILSCARARWYTIKEKKSDASYELDPLTLSKFRDGNEAHIKLGVLFNDCGIKVLGREIVSNCKGIYIRFDYKIRIKDQDYNLEFKTMSDDTFTTFLRYGIVAFPGYFAQCQLMAGSEPILPSIILCKNKSSSAYHDETIKLDNEYVDSLVQLKDKFDESIVSDTKPQRPYDYDNPSCASCQYRLRCWFSHIRQEVMIEGDLNKTEKNVIDTLFTNIETNYESYINYVDDTKELKNYIAFLHTKHKSSKLKFDGILSSLVITNTIKYDMPYILSLLSESQLDKAISYKENKYFRTKIK